MRKILLGSIAAILFSGVIMGAGGASPAIKITKFSTDKTTNPWTVEVDGSITGGAANTKYQWTLVATDGTNKFPLEAGATITTDKNGSFLPVYKSNGSGLKNNTKYTFTISLFTKDQDPTKDKPISSDSQAYTIGN